MHGRQTAPVNGKINRQASVDGVQRLVVPYVQSPIFVSVDVQDADVNVVSKEMNQCQTEG